MLDPFSRVVKAGSPIHRRGWVGEKDLMTLKEMWTPHDTLSLTMAMPEHQSTYAWGHVVSSGASSPCLKHKIMRYAIYEITNSSPIVVRKIAPSSGNNTMKNAWYEAEERS